MTAIRMLVNTYLLVSGAGAEGLRPTGMAAACVLHHLATAILGSCVFWGPDEDWLLTCGVQVWGSWNIYFSSKASEKGFFRFEAAKDNQLLSRRRGQEKSSPVMTSLRASVRLSVLRLKARLRELASISMPSFLNLPSLLSACAFESCYLLWPTFLTL